MTTPLSYQFSEAINIAGLSTGARIDYWERRVGTSIVPAFGALLVLNGIDHNQKVVNPLASANYLPLVGNAPYGELAPLLGPIGAGSVFGKNYKWLYRFKASTTGEVTGFSAVPVNGVSLGMELTSGSVLGQDASFTLAGRGGDDGTYFDRIQLFRNTSNDFSIYYLVKEVANPGSGSTVFVLDDVTDETLLVSGAETDGLLPNPSHAVGPPWPCAKAYAHPSGAFCLYGTIPMPPFRNGTATIAADAYTATITGDYTPIGVTPAGGGVDVPRNRVGQRFVPLTTSGGSTITPTQGYRVCALGLGSVEGEVDITPKWAEGALSGFHYEIIDDRDERTVFVSEPGKPSQYDLTKALSIGADRTDGVQHIWGFRSRRFAITKRRIYAWGNDSFVDPDVIVSFTEVAQEGACGLWAMAETPAGLVFIEATKGPRIFQATSSSDIGVDPPMPLGGASAEHKFLALTQFQGVDPDYLGQTRVLYDPIRHQVYVSYCPLGGGGLEESLVFDMATGVWRGPWRTHLTSTFELIDDGGARRQVFGDEFGNVLTADGAALDVVNQFTGQIITGTISTVDGKHVFTANSAVFDPNSDKRVIGCPIVFSDGAGNYYTNWIAGYASNQFQLLNIPSPALQAGWTFQIGALRWQLTTAPINAGEPIQPKTFVKLRTGFERGHTGDSTALLGVAVNGGTTFETEIAGAETTIDPAADTEGTGDDGSVYTEGRIMRHGRNFQIRVRGTSVKQTPKLTQEVADIDVGSGA